MKLDRNINSDGKGKYAVVRLRAIEKGTEAYDCLMRLGELGHLDWGTVGQPDEFFVIKLRDKYSMAALRGYSDAVMNDASQEPDQEKYKSLVKWALEVQGLQARAGVLSEFCKEPD